MKKHIICYFIHHSLIMILLLGLKTPAFPQNNILVWQDEFSVNGLPDEEKWGYDVGASGWGNQELQFYTEARSENARVADGKLIIEAHKETFGGAQYTSARLVTKNKGDWKYGRIEVKAKVPAGTGTWPAIWMLPTDWAYGGWPASGEIDVMEYVGYQPNTVHQTIHTQAYNHSQGTQQGQSFNIPTAEEAFHVYAIEWDEEQIQFFIDDTPTFLFENQGTWEKWPFDKRFHLLLNVAIGGTWGGAQGVDDSIFPVSMEVDYVRVYQTLLSIEENPASKDVRMYPNPTKDYLLFDNKYENWNAFKISDISGRKVLSGTKPSTKKIIIQKLEPGLYFIDLTDENDIIKVRKKFIKQ